MIGTLGAAQSAECLGQPTYRVLLLLMVLWRMALQNHDGTDGSTNILLQSVQSKTLEYWVNTACN